MKLEIGGGTRNRPGWINLDRIPTADIVWNLDEAPWPVADDSCTAIYSSHCLEHLWNPHLALREICRIGQIGCEVEIRVPDGEAAMIPGHEFHLSETWIRNLCDYFPESFPHESRILRLSSITRNPNHLHWPAAKRAYPHLEDQEILQVCYRASFELVILATVAARASG